MKQKLNRNNRYQKILDRLAETGDDDGEEEEIDGDEALNELIQAGVKTKKLKGKKSKKGKEAEEEEVFSKKHNKIQTKHSKKGKSIRPSSQEEFNTDSKHSSSSSSSKDDDGIEIGDSGLPVDIENLLNELLPQSNKGNKKPSPKKRRRLLKKIRRELRRGNRKDKKNRESAVEEEEEEEKGSRKKDKYLKNKGERGKYLNKEGKKGALTEQLKPDPTDNSHPLPGLQSLLDKIFEEIPQDRRQLHKQLETLLSRLQYVALRKVEAQLGHELTSSTELVKIVKELKDLALVSKWTKKLEKVILENPSKITPPGMKGFTLLGRVKEMSSAARNEQNKQKDMRNSGYKHSKASVIPLPKDEDTKTG